MAESWFSKLKSAISNTMNQETRRSTVGILAFEIASLMSKQLHLWRSLSDAGVARLRHETIALEGTRKVVSDDDAFLLSLACAELTQTLRSIADCTSLLSRRCSDQALRRFDQSFKSFADSGEDPNRWAMSCKEMESKAKKMDRYVASAASLYKEMDELGEAEQGLKRLLQSKNSLRSSSIIKAIADAQQSIFWQRQEIKYLKQSSLWGCNFDAAITLLAKSSFTVLARIKLVFGISGLKEIEIAPISRSLSVSAAVYPSSETTLSMNFWPDTNCGFFELSSSMIVPPATTLGAAALALHYANVIAVIEKMIRTPRAVGPDARDDLYSMLPASLRGLLRSRLRGVGWGAARDGGLAEEWRAALDRIVEWLGPVAHNTIRWQAERSFERRRSGGGAGAVAARGNVMVLQTLYFANREKVEAAIGELLVGLNYVWRFEREMCLDIII